MKQIICLLILFISSTSLIKGQLTNDGVTIIMDFPINVITSVEIINTNSGTIINNGTITSNVNFDNAGLLKGTGTVNGNIVTSTGTTSPGESPGIFSVSGNYTQNNIGTLLIEIAGNGGPGNIAGHDQLNVSGSATLDGTLTVNLLGGFTPSPGDMYTIVLYNSRSGMFLTENLPDISPNSWIVHYNANDIILEFMAVVPLELLSFEGILKDRQVILSWETIHEINSQGFEVQHAGKDLNWTSVGFIQSKAADGQFTRYSFTHPYPIPRENYYRLKQIDWDGGYFLSEVLTFNIKSDEIEIYPNPVSDILYIDGLTRESTWYSIRDVYGKTHSFGMVDNDRIDISSLVPGVYFLNLINEVSDSFPILKVK